MKNTFYLILLSFLIFASPLNAQQWRFGTDFNGKVKEYSGADDKFVKNLRKNVVTSQQWLQQQVAISKNIREIELQRKKETPGTKEYTELSSALVVYYNNFARCLIHQGQFAGALETLYKIDGYTGKSEVVIGRNIALCHVLGGKIEFARKALDEVHRRRLLVRKAQREKMTKKMKGKNAKSTADKEWLWHRYLSVKEKLIKDPQLLIKTGVLELDVRQADLDTKNISDSFGTRMGWTQVSWELQTFLQEHYALYPKPDPARAAFVREFARIQSRLGVLEQASPLYDEAKIQIANDLRLSGNLASEQEQLQRKISANEKSGQDSRSGLNSPFVRFAILVLGLALITISLYRMIRRKREQNDGSPKN